MNLSAWRRLRRIRRNRRNVVPYTVLELADFIAEVRRPSGFES